MSGISDSRVLEVDHVFNDGSTERNICDQKPLRKISRQPERYQLLCANCHVIKTHETINLKHDNKIQNEVDTPIQLSFFGEA